MINFFDKVASEWSTKGLGVVIGEWGITDHFNSSEADRIHENMSYYCKLLVSEARKRGFSTFVWDNNRFGNGADQFGIFDRNKNISIKSDWMIKDINEGVAASVVDPK